MSGITGIFNYNNQEKIDEDLLIRMRDIMVHRGPDGFGLWISNDKKIGLAYRRLSIIDLSKLASQPMTNEDNTIFIVANGEIYNHKIIRLELEKKGHKFKTDHSDTEVIVHSYEEWGAECIQKFRGVYAFAIWDSRKNELLLFRDFIGVKPLYYMNINGKFLFASEIKSILVDKTIKRELNTEGLYNYLSFLTVPAPQTMFKNIYKLPAGCYLTINKNGNIKIKKYWDVFEHTEDLSSASEDEIAGRILEELKISIKFRKIGDVPVGIFLSGGIDSSTNLSLFSDDINEKTKAFTIGYAGDNKSYENEFEYARLMTTIVNTEYYEKMLDIDEFLNFLKTLIFHQDEPLADPVCFPVYAVSKLAKENGVSVCQVGEGSDELFMGYPGWNTMLNLYKTNEKYKSRLFKKAGLSMLGLTGKKRKSYYEWLRRAVSNEPIFWSGAEAYFEYEKQLLLSENFIKDFKYYSSYEIIKPIYNNFKEKAWEKTPLAWMSYSDLNLRLPELLLMRVDKMSMAASLETRVPFLDHKFVELAMSIPQHIKAKDNILKYILKKAVKNVIPDEIINRKKQGFGVPINEWFFSQFGSFTNSKLKEFSKKTDYFDPRYINNIVNIGNTEKHNADKLWYLLNFALWYEEWIEN